MIDISALRALCEQAPETIDLELKGRPYLQYEVPTQETKAFYEAARTALPALIDEVSRLRGEVERMRTVAVKLIECFDDGSLQVDHTDADTDPLRPVPVCGDDHDACSRETCPAVWVVNDAARIIEHRFNGPTAISTARKGEP
jgi:hypothetical protein